MSPAVETEAFDYELPAQRIAQEPCQPRDAARLLVHAVRAGSTVHARVRDLADFLGPGDLLVVNDTRVRRARLLGRRPSGGAVELLLLEPCGQGRWRALAKPAGRLRPLERVELAGGAGWALLLEREVAGPAAQQEPTGAWILELRNPRCEVPAQEELEAWGQVPLPPYIQRAKDDPRAPADRERYQTIFAEKLGAVAAPTAGLHFTPELMQRLAERGAQLARLTLHVGPGTFQPVTVQAVEQHVMHAESFELDPACADAIARCRARGGRVIAVGTTSARTLEHCADGHGGVRPGHGRTSLFLRPGSRFQVIDALLTNFHLPRSTLLMLVSAFAGLERTLSLYRAAVAEGYRFYSYGDAMLLTDRSRDA
jgi:S-adenosylmethionine:tRNA ribosyltransferase-isomerase